MTCSADRCPADSDAIVLNFGLNITSLGSRYSTADLIASADIRMGLINSGVMVLRNTPWMRSFLQRWWEIADRSMVCDQEAFDMLYRELSSQDQMRIQLLATDALNSHPPAWKHLSDNNAVLHLMGESAFLRGKVFQTAFTAVCDARSGGVLRKLLALSADSLQSTARDVYRHETQEAFIAANHTGFPDDIQRFSLASHRYVDVLNAFLASALPAGKPTVTNSIQTEKNRRKAAAEIINLREALFKLCLHHVEVTKQLLAEGQGADGELADRLVALLKQSAEAGNSFFWSLHVLEDRVHVAELCFSLLAHLRDIVSQQSLWIVEHMTALMEQNLGSVFYDAYKQANNAQHLDQAIVHLKASLKGFEEHLSSSSDSSIQVEHLHTLQLLAAANCGVDDFWPKVIEKARSNLFVEEGMHYERLAAVLYNAALCYKERPALVIDARQLLTEAVSIFKKILSNKQELVVDGVEAKGIKALLANAQLLLGEQPEVKEMKLPKEIPRMHIVQEDGQAKYVTDEDEEWEECPEGEMDGCEDFLVTTSPPAAATPALPTTTNASNVIVSNVYSADMTATPFFRNDDAHIFLGLTNKEADVLLGIRQQYKHVVHRQAAYRAEHDIWDLLTIGQEPDPEPAAHTEDKPAPVESDTSCRPEALKAMQVEMDKLRLENKQMKDVLVGGAPSPLSPMISPSAWQTHIQQLSRV